MSELSVDPKRLRHFERACGERLPRSVRQALSMSLDVVLARGEHAPAWILERAPLRIGLYLRELDAPLELRLPEKAGFDLQGQPLPERLLAILQYSPNTEGFASDLEPGPKATGQQGNVWPLIADLLCAQELEPLKAAIPAEEWERGQRVHERIWRREARPGWPLRAQVPSGEGPGPPASRRRRRWPWILLALLLGLPALLVLVAHVYLRHVPYAIPTELKAPSGGDLSLQKGGVRLRWLGISGYELSDGKTTILLDPTLTRPTLGQLISGPIHVEEEGLKGIRRADFILVNHAHHDHAMDVPALAKRTGAVVLGSTSTIQLCRSRGVPDKQLRVVEAGQVLTLGTFKAVVGDSKHTSIMGVPNPMGGVIPSDAEDPLWFFQYTNDGCRSYHLTGGGATLWFHPTSTFAEGELRGLKAQTLILGVTGDPQTPEKLKPILAVVRPKRVIPTHYDNFFFPRSAGLGLMPRVDLFGVRDMLHAVDPDLDYWVFAFDQSVAIPPDR